MGYGGSYRTTRRAVAEAKRRWRQTARAADAAVDPAAGVVAAVGLRGRARGRGPRAVLFCAWLAWCRFRVVVPLRDKTLASVVIGLDRTLRLVGSVPTYALTDNEKTVTVEHVCGIAVRNATIVEVSRHYGLTIATCEPADPQTKGGSEATVKIAKADLVPTDHNLRERVRRLAGAGAGVPGVHGRCEHAAAPRDPRSRRWSCWRRSMSTCTGCHVSRTRCASGRPARSTAKRPSVGR